MSNPATGTLVTESRFPNPDAAYQAIVDAHRGLSDAESADLNVRLLLVLANHIGDLDVLQEAIAVAKSAMADPGRTPDV